MSAALPRPDGVIRAATAAITTISHTFGDAVAEIKTADSNQAGASRSQGHEQIGDPTIADSILDRIVHDAYRIELNGESLRKKKVRKPEEGGES